MYLSAKTDSSGSSFLTACTCTYKSEHLYARTPDVTVEPAQSWQTCRLRHIGSFALMCHEYDSKEWEALARRITWRDGRRCKAVCGCTANLTVHHIIPRRENGSDDPDNLITLCIDCHNEIEDTAIRTLAGVLAYIPRWHAFVSWYPTEHPTRTPAQRTKKRGSSTKRQMPQRKPLPPKKQATVQEAVCPSCGRVFIKHKGNHVYCNPYCKTDVSVVKWYLAHPYEQMSKRAQKMLETLPVFRSHSTSGK